jgi:histidinol-phosphate aminotransferase
MSSVTSPPAKLPDAPSFPPHFNLKSIIRPNILALHPYRCARDDYEEGVLLDANENALGPALFGDVPPLVDTKAKAKSNPNGDATQKPSVESDPLAGLDISSLSLHRYPSPSHIPIKQRIADMRKIPSPDYVFLGVGSDEVIDLLMRICVKPGRNGDVKDEKILITPPTYGMYGVCAQVNDVEVVKVPLDVEGGRFQVRMEEVRSAELYLM